MDDRYLLPCSCGRKVAITRRQAGEAISCACGAQLQAPTLREILRLEPANLDATSKDVPSTWGLWSRIALIGWILWLAAAGVGVALYQTWPADPLAFDLKMLQDQVDSMRPADTLAWWEEVSRGADAVPRPRDLEAQYAQQLEIHHFGVGAVVLLVCLGGVLVSLPLWMRSAPQRSHQPVSGRQ